MNEISVKELAIKTREAMRSSGIAEFSIWKQYNDNLLAIVRWFKKRGHEQFRLDIANEYLNAFIAENSANIVTKVCVGA